LRAGLAYKKDWVARHNKSRTAQSGMMEFVNKQLMLIYSSEANE